MPLKLEGGYWWEDMVCYISCSECDPLCENVWKESSMCRTLIADCFSYTSTLRQWIFRRMDMRYIALPKWRTCILQSASQQRYSPSLGISESLGFQAHKKTLEKNTQLSCSTVKSCNQWNQRQKALAADLCVCWHSKREELMLKVVKRKPLHRILYTVL